MITQGTSTHPKLPDITLSMQSLFGQLSSNSSEPATLLAWLKRVKKQLDYILIGTFDYDIAQSRIRNAVRYLESCEIGAAKYEIHLLMGEMRSQFKTPN